MITFVLTDTFQDHLRISDPLQINHRKTKQNQRSQQTSREECEVSVRPSGVIVTCSPVSLSSTATHTLTLTHTCSGALAALHRLHLHQVVGLGPGGVVLPHLQVQSLQLLRVLFGVEERAADALLPDAGAHLLQAERDERGTDNSGFKVRLSQRLIRC